MNHSETSARTFVELAKQDPSEPGTDDVTWLGGDTGALTTCHTCHNCMSMLVFILAGSQMQSAGSSGLSDFLSGAGPQGSSPSAPGAKTDLLGRALSSNKQDSFDFIGVSHLP